jgi:hypothetical protein
MYNKLKRKCSKEQRKNTLKNDPQTKTPNTKKKYNRRIILTSKKKLINQEKQKNNTTKSPNSFKELAAIQMTSHVLYAHKILEKKTIFGLAHVAVCPCICLVSKNGSTM